MVRSVRIRLLVFLFLPIGAWTKLSSSGNSCKSSQGWDGYCMLSYECPGLGELVVKGYTPELCNTAGPVVCCPSGSPDDVLAFRPGSAVTTGRPINISPSPTPYVAEESHPLMRKVSLPSMRIRKRRPSVKRHAHILVKTYSDDEEGSSILIRTHRLKPTRRRKRRPVSSHTRNPGNSLSRTSYKNHRYPVYHDTSPGPDKYSVYPESSPAPDHFSLFTGSSPEPDHLSLFSDASPETDQPQISLAAQIAEAKLEADQEAALLLADMSSHHSVSVTVRPSRSHYSTSATSPSPSSPAPSMSTPRMSRIMCDAYSEAMMETVAELSKKGVVPKKTEKCTLTSMLPNSKTTAAFVGEFPHVVGLGYIESNLKTVWGKCSGALISEEFVLTAAHCTHAPSGRPVNVGMGSKTLASDAEIGIKDIIVHPLYNKTTYAHDLALLRLAKKTRLSDTMRPACLQTTPVTPRTLVASHWSNLPPVTVEIKMRTNETRLFSNPEVMGLQKEKMTQLKNKDCDINSELTESFLCAQSTVHRRNSNEQCQGYGGDSLQYRNAGNKCMYTIVGIAVENVCDDSPIAFTKVSHYLSWIESVVWS